MPPETLTLCFLGERTYLQGTTLFEALVDRCRGGSDLCFKLSRLMNTDRVSVAALESDEAGGYAASLLWSENEKRCALGVSALPPSELPRREQFDEAGLVGLAEIGEEAACLERPSPFPLVQTLVALNKALLLRTLAPPGPGQWLFTRLDLSRYPDHYSLLRVRYRHRHRFAAVSSAIDVDEETVGEVLFSWLPK